MDERANWKCELTTKDLKRLGNAKTAGWSEDDAVISVSDHSHRPNPDWSKAMAKRTVLGAALSQRAS